MPYRFATSLVRHMVRHVAPVAIACCGTGVLAQTEAYTEAVATVDANASTTRACRTLVDTTRESLFDFNRLRTLSPADAVKGERIANVIVMPLPIFDESNPRENLWLYRTANKLHIDTSPGVISQQLLFTQGDRVSTSKLSESERILRASKYLFDAAIVPIAQCNDGVDLLVLTREVWTLEPQVSFSQSGGNSKSSAGISDDNILGTGNRASLSYKSDADRDSITAAYKNENVFGTRWQIRSEYADTSDGATHKLSLARPFYSLDTRWATGFSTERSDLNQEIHIPDSYAGFDDDTHDFQHEYARDDIYVGFSQGLQHGFTRRWSVGVTTEEHHFSSAQGMTVTAMERERVYPWFEYQWVEDRFTTLENLYQIHRTEDVPLGINLRTRIGYAPARWDTYTAYGEQAQWVYDIEALDTLSDGRHHLFQLSMLINGAWLVPDDRAQNVLTSTRAEYHGLDSPYRRWYAKLQFDYGKDLTPDQFMTLGGEDTLRGYPRDLYYADQRTLLTLERRYFSDIHLFNLIRLGGAAFIDAGKSRLSVDADEDSPWLADAGLGLRLSSSKSSSGMIIHFDLAFPLVDRSRYDSYQWTVTTKETF